MHAPPTLVGVAAPPPGLQRRSAGGLQRRSAGPARLNGSFERADSHAPAACGSANRPRTGLLKPASNRTMKFSAQYGKYSDLKLRMGPSESSRQSSRRKICGRASEVWSGARSARFTLGNRAHRVAFARSARSKKTFPQKTKKLSKKLGQVRGRVSTDMSERASAMKACGVVGGPAFG
jgi:hypothetical protein